MKGVGIFKLSFGERPSICAIGYIVKAFIYFPFGDFPTN